MPVPCVQRAWPASWTRTSLTWRPTSSATCSFALRWEPDDVADQLGDPRTVLGPPLVMTADWLRHAAALARTHTLSFYDASWAATAIALRMPLVSADTWLLAAGLAESPRDIVTRLKLPPDEPPATPEEPRRGARAALTPGGAHLRSGCQ
jgi:hypothetical protein